MGFDRELRQACVYQGIPPRLWDWFQAVIDLDAGLREFRPRGDAGTGTRGFVESCRTLGSSYPGCEPLRQNRTADVPVFSVKPAGTLSGRVPDPCSTGKSRKPQENGELNPTNPGQVQSGVPGGVTKPRRARSG